MAAKRKRTEYEIRILTAFRRIIRAIDLHSRKLSAEFKVTAPQLITLLTVAESSPATSAELARLVHVSPSTMVGILDRLEHKGLVVRERSTEDRRRIHVTLTPEGKKLVKRAPSPLQDKLSEALGRLPELEQATIALSLERVVDLMEARAIEAAPILETGTLDINSNGPNRKNPPAANK